MKRGKWTRITAVLFAAALLAALCGCGDTPPEVSDPTTTTSTTTTTTATTTVTTTTTTTKKPTTTATTGTTTTTATIIPENPNISLPLQHVSKVETIPNGKQLSVQPHTITLRDTLPLRFSEDGLWVVCVSNMTQLDAFKKSMLDSYAESLSSFDEEYRNRSVDENKTEIEQAYSQYDATYFNTKSLVMVFLPCISSSLRETVTNFVRQGNEICIDWIYHFPKSGAVSDDVNPRYMLVEMKTEDLIGVEKWSHHKTIEYY